NDEAVAAKQLQIGGERRAGKAGGLLLEHNEVLWTGCDLVDDGIAVSSIAVQHRRFCAPLRLPAPGARVPVVRAPDAGRVDHRNALVAAQPDQLLQDRNGVPCVFAAGGAPLLDALQNGHRLLVAESIVHIDDDEGRALAPIGKRTKAGCCHYGLVAFGQKLVPYAVSHVSHPLAGLRNLQECWQHSPWPCGWHRRRSRTWWRPELRLQRRRLQSGR